ncbi:M13 family metallopeptidase [Burkholderiaceae bacterium DAT-1]|nr:M13 family metallopeptidase [Burkholderiaceae bacterium DAT-1]
MRLSRIAAILMAIPCAAFAAPHSGIELENFDQSVRIQDDLFQAVNGNWIKRTEIPADRSRWGAFDQLRELSENRVHELIEANVARPANADQKRIAALYQSYMDEKSIEKAGLKPLEGSFKEIAAVKDAASLNSLIGRWQVLGVRLPLRVYVGIDAKDATRYQVSVRQSGLGMPDRDYYLENDDRFVKIRAAYIDYLTTLFTLAGDKADAAKAKAGRVFALEKRIAEIQWTKVVNRDPVKTYNKRSLAALSEEAPAIAWKTILQQTGLKDVQELNLAQPDYAKALGELINTVPASEWQDYLKARLLADVAPMLPKAFADADFKFNGVILNGQKEQRARWKRAVSFVDSAVGESVGQQYVAKYFPVSAKSKMEELVANLFKAYQSSIDNISWMSPETRTQAQDKLSKYTVKIGYPQKWRDYSSIRAKSNDLIGNARRVAEFEHAYRISKLGKPVDRSEWGMTPQTVNAYYNASFNEIVFPAAILQPPFFNAAADDAVNYGGIGAVIGHEISHGFDDKGSQYDGNGNLRMWWTAEDRSRFEGLAGRLVAQYESYEPIPGRHINGKLTLGENIADLSGLQIAYKAYQLSQGGKPAEKLDGYTGDQRFFIGFAQVWRTKMRDEAALTQLTTDPHSPGAYRANGTPVNSDAFQTAFDVQPTDKMFKPSAERIRIW